jgi:D-arabinose 1-dehydrogenase-like Zn-dependent alcohol dehydrogenase
MRARLIATGWDQDLAYEPEAPPPDAPLENQLLVEVEACGVCHRDLIDRDGRFPFQQLPITPGHEAVGIVTAVGPAVTQWKIGDRVATLHRDACGQCGACRAGETSLCEGAAWVFGILRDGGYASHLTAPEACFFAVPPSLPAAEAATLHCTFGTAYRDLTTLGGLRAGERVLVTGANGGVGGAAVQIAARLGAEVVAVIRDARHTDYVKALGAHEVVVDAGQSFHKQIGRVDLALEAVGHSTFTSALRSLKIGGRIVVVGNIVPKRVELNLGYIITSGLTIRGGSGANRAEMASLLALHQQTPFQIRIDRTLPLSRADEAQRLVKRGGLQGRVVLVSSYR